jgi:hypothetical protein
VHVHDTATVPPSATTVFLFHFLFSSSCFSTSCTSKCKRLHMYSSTSTKSKNLQHESCVKQQDQATLKIKFQMIDCV